MLPKKAEDTLRSETRPEHKRVPNSEGYSFCESSTATSNHWHIRRLDNSGKHTSGGITTPSLCGAVMPFSSGGLGGWDIIADITPHHLDHNCPECMRLFEGK